MGFFGMGSLGFRVLGMGFLGLGGGGKGHRWFFGFDRVYMFTRERVLQALYGDIGVQGFTGFTRLQRVLQGFNACWVSTGCRSWGCPAGC